MRPHSGEWKCVGDGPCNIYFNLIKYFHKDYDTNIDLLNEHMECIKELNPAVYDVAIEL